MATQKVADIPVIDLNSENAASELLDAAEKWGFVFVNHRNLELHHHDVDKMFDLSRNFFQSSPSVKGEFTIHSSKSGKNHGWLSMHTEKLNPAHQKKGDFKEAFNVGEFRDGRAQQPLPKPLEHREIDIGRFMEDCHVLCNRILKLFGIALKIPQDEGGENWFSARHDQSKGASGSVLRLLYYPALPESEVTNPEEDIRAGAHSDYGSITLLFRLPSQAGLEILTPENTWATVPVDPDPASSSGTLPILVNIGDLLSYWTNGLLKSTVHRVTFPKEGLGPRGGEERFSIAYFCHPEDDAKLVEVPSEVLERRGKELKDRFNKPAVVLTARDHLNSRLAATYNL